MVIFPLIETYFIAAEKKAEFIGKFIDEIIIILKYPMTVNEDIAEKRYNYISVDGKDVYY